MGACGQDPIHPPGTIEETLPKDKHLGEVDMSTVAKAEEAEETRPQAAGAITQLGECLNLEDIEVSLREPGIDRDAPD